MLDAVVVSQYRSLRDLAFSPGPLTLVTGSNGSGKSNLYRALRLLHRSAAGGLSLALAEEGGRRRRLRQTST